MNQDDRKMRELKKNFEDFYKKTASKPAFKEILRRQTKSIIAEHSLFSNDFEEAHGYATESILKNIEEGVVDDSFLSNDDAWKPYFLRISRNYLYDRARRRSTRKTKAELERQVEFATEQDESIALFYSGGRFEGIENEEEFNSASLEHYLTELEFASDKKRVTSLLEQRGLTTEQIELLVKRAEGFSFVELAELYGEKSATIRARFNTAIKAGNLDKNSIDTVNRKAQKTETDCLPSE